MFEIDAPWDMSDDERSLADGYDPHCTGYGPDRCTNKCAACNYIQHNVPSASDEGHDSLCCGSEVCTETNPDMPCYGHMSFDEEKSIDATEDLYFDGYMSGYAAGEY